MFRSNTVNLVLTKLPFALYRFCHIPYTYSICCFTNFTPQSKSYLAHGLSMSERSGAMQKSIYAAFEN